jgi:DNA-directed RNA polymerase subunit RPC12/RpoP
VNYKCPACTGPLHFAGESGKLECEYCGSSYTVAEIESLYKKHEEESAQAFKEEEEKPAGEMQEPEMTEEPETPDQEEPEKPDQPQGGGETWDTSGLNDWIGAGAALRSYSCPSCGAELICDENTAALRCPYCGNPTVVPGQLSGVLRPDYVLPFKLKKERAQQALLKHYEGKTLLPDTFRDENNIKEIQGVYVPFWLFDGVADVSLEMTASDSRSFLEGDYEVTETMHYDVERRGDVSFEKIPVDAASKMPDQYMDALEPYDYEKLEPFSMAYLAGYLTDKFDVSVEQSAKRADERAANSAIDILKNTVQHEVSTIRSKTVALKRGKVHYALIPVWLLTIRWEEKQYMFAVNGQTGKVVGELPSSEQKARKEFWKSFAITLAAGIPILSILMYVLLYSM